MQAARESALETIKAALEASIADGRMADDERWGLVEAVRQAGLNPEALNALRNQAFKIARANITAWEPHSLLRWAESAMRVVDAGRLPPRVARNSASFSPGVDCLGTIVGHLQAVRRTVDLCVFTLSDDRISREVLAAHKRGVVLRFITDNAKEHDAGSDIAQLRQAGINIRVDRTDAHMHHKFAIFDGAWLLNGSYNWTRSACEYNEENLVASNDAALVAAFQDEFGKLWARLGE